ncbi:uncharacterized protein LOC123668156 [Melitaea cinxia]|uniref:uncharacterized protein LOC123668156 n=1 Tax=Melitaea cinxia TaxID=113334 RepID=UPI001E27017F|nr:uncharacterized protein LOC123668156 [Melitaea cinxia]
MIDEVESVVFLRSCLIVPGEVPSILDTAFLPPFKKGTDSKAGFGFAFGNHADFQVVLELGPQINTMPLTSQPFPKNSNSNKIRQAPVLATMKIDNREKNVESDAGNYLQNWAQRMKSKQKIVRQLEKPTDVHNLEETKVESVKNEKKRYEIQLPKPGYIAQFILESLKKIYGQNKKEAKKMVEEKRIKDVKKITEDLSNVDMD